MNINEIIKDSRFINDPKIGDRLLTLDNSAFDLVRIECNDKFVFSICNPHNKNEGYYQVIIEKRKNSTLLGKRVGIEFCYLDADEIDKLIQNHSGFNLKESVISNKLSNSLQVF